VGFLEAHEQKIVALDTVNFEGDQFVVSASSDRLVHIFYLEGNDISVLQSIDSHAASLQDVKF